jgi:phenylalanyl-tRNA synthetase beta chain
MVIVDTKFSEMQELIQGDLTIEKLEQVLADMGMELDDVNGDEIKIEITAERVDLITPAGLARAINCYHGKTKYQEITTEPSDYIHKVDPSVKKVRPFTRSFVVKNLRLDEDDIKALMTVQEKIHDTFGRKRKKVSIGVYDLDKLTFPIHYKAMKPQDIRFKPLEMTQELNGKEILEQHEKGKTYAHLLEGEPLYPIQIDSANKILSMPPIINSDDLGKINTNTKNILVESTGPDAESLDNIMNILAVMFSDMQGEIHTVTVEDHNEKFICPSTKQTQKEISIKYVNKWIGLDVNAKTITEYLNKMEYNVQNITGDNITVSIPSVRCDIWHQVDIADDIARGFGYNNIKPTVPNISTIGAMLPENILYEDIANFLVNFGLMEVKTFALTNHTSQYEDMNIKEQPHIKLGKNTTDKTLSMVRSWLIPEILKTLVANRNKEYPQKVFEIGTVVIPDQTKDVKARNEARLACLLCDDKTDFTKAKQILDAVMRFIGIKYYVRESKHPSFITGRIGEIIVDDDTIGIIGEINPEVLVKWDLMMPTVGFEIDLEKINK